MSKNREIVFSRGRMIKRIPAIEEKKSKNHNYRNSLNTTERKMLCDWCDQTRLGNNLHFF